MSLFNRTRIKCDSKVVSSFSSLTIEHLPAPDATNDCRAKSKSSSSTRNLAFSFSDSLTLSMGMSLIISFAKSSPIFIILYPSPRTALGRETPLDEGVEYNSPNLIYSILIPPTTLSSYHRFSLQEFEPLH